MPETFTLDEFTNGDWSDRPEYASESPAWTHIVAIHKAEKDFQEIGRCADSDFWFLLHGDDTHFSFYLYLANTWAGKSEPYSDYPLCAEPIMWIYGTTFDGVRECSVGQNFSAVLPELAAALIWIHEECCRRWPRFAEWYRPMKSRCP